MIWLRRAGLLPIACGIALASAAPARPGLPPGFVGPFETDPAVIREAAERADAESDSSAVILTQRLEWSLDADHRVSRRFYYLVLLRNEEAADDVDWKTLSTTWHPWNQERPTFRARVLTPEGDVLHLDLDTLVESPVASEAGPEADRRVRLEAPLPGIRPGSVIETEVVTRDFRSLFPGRRYTVWTDAPSWVTAELAHGQIVVSVPETLPLRWDPGDGPGTLEETTAGGEHRLVYTIEDRPEYESLDPGTPIEWGSLPLLSFSTGESWQAIATEYSRRIDEALAGADFGETLASVASIEDRRRRAGQLLRAIRRQVELASLELFEAALEPTSPAETLKRGWGTPIDVATLVLGALRADGFDADLAVFQSRPTTEPPQDLPGLGGFSNLVLRLRLDDETLWFHPATPWSAIDILGASAAGRRALVLSPETRQLVTLPSPRPGDDRRVLHREIQLSSFGGPAFEERQERHGVYAAPERTTLDLFGHEAVEQFLGDHAAQVHGAETTVKTSIEGAGEAEGPVIYRISGDTSQALGTTHFEESGVFLGYAEVLASLVGDFQLDEDTPRRHPFERGAREIFELRNRVVAPPGFVLEALPENREVELGVVRLSESYRSLTGEGVAGSPVVESAWVFDSGSRRMTAEEYEATRRALRRELQRPDPRILFHHSALRLMGEGLAGEALAGHRQRLAENPRDVTEHIRLSRTLLEVGLVDEARRVARRAVDLDPEDPWTHWAVAWSLMRDPVGRQYFPGQDRAGALAALDRAVELNPDLETVASERLFLLMYDEEGRFLDQNPDLDRFLELHEAWRGQFGDAYDEHRRYGLFRAGRYEELRAATADPQDERAQLYHLLAATLLEGTDATLRQTRRLGLTGEDRVETLFAVAQTLFGARHYAEAAELLRMGAATSSNPAQLGAQAELWARIERIESLAPIGDSPESLILHLVQRCIPELAGDRGTSLKDLLPAGLDPGAAESFADTWSDSCRLYADDSDLHRLEFLLGGLEMEVKGDLDDLKKVSLTLDGFGEESVGEFYVLREAGAWKLAGVRRWASHLASLARDRLPRGDTTFTRQVLDWERESRSVRDSSDPFGFSPFVRLWSVGQEAEVADLEIALAALLTEDSTLPERGLEIFERALESVDDPELEKIYELARIDALRALRRYDELETTTRRLHEVEPGSDRIFGDLLFALRRNERWQEAEALIARRLENQPDDLFTHSERFFLFNAYDDPRLAEAVTALEAAAGNDLRASTLNILAWSLLFDLGDDPAATLEWSLRLSQQAVQKSEYENAARLHTLATIYGLLGRPVEAYRVLLQALEERDGNEITEDDWLVMGLVAESCGEITSARDFYRRLRKPPEPTSRSSWRLAQQRLERLGPEPEKERRTWRERRQERKRRRQAADG